MPLDLSIATLACLSTPVGIAHQDAGRPAPDTSSIALAFDRGVQASSNVGDGRACIHVLPLFREIAPRKSATTVGRLYWSRAEPEQMLERFHKDFPKLPQD